jgi:hypothetical protein
MFSSGFSTDSLFNKKTPFYLNCGNEPTDFHETQYQ